MTTASSKDLSFVGKKKYQRKKLKLYYNRYRRELLNVPL